MGHLLPSFVFFSAENDHAHGCAVGCRLQLTDTLGSKRMMAFVKGT